MCDSSSAEILNTYLTLLFAIAAKVFHLFFFFSITLVRDYPGVDSKLLALGFLLFLVISSLGKLIHLFTVLPGTLTPIKLRDRILLYNSSSIHFNTCLYHLCLASLTFSAMHVAPHNLFCFFLILSINDILRVHLSICISPMSIIHILQCLAYSSVQDQL